MPKPLHFKPDSVSAIPEGSERLTVRRAGSGYQPGDLVKAVARPNPAFAELKLTKVERLPLESLTRGHLRRSGWSDLPSLKQSVTAIYPDDAEFDVISFECGGALK